MSYNCWHSPSFLEPPPPNALHRGCYHCLAHPFQNGVLGLGHEKDQRSKRPSKVGASCSASTNRSMNQTQTAASGG